MIKFEGRRKRDEGKLKIQAAQGKKEKGGYKKRGKIAVTDMRRRWAISPAKKRKKSGSAYKKTVKKAGE